jgi:hypothetical protein
VDNDDDIWKRVNFTTADVSSSAPWVVACAARNAGRNASGASLSGILGKHAAQMGAQNSSSPDGSSLTVLTGSAAGSPEAANGSSSSGDFGGSAGAADGTTWTQTPDEVEVVCAAPPGTTKLDVAVAFSARRLEVRFGGGVALKGDLGGAVDVSGCTWTLDGGNLVVSLEKRESSDWPFSLKMDADLA